MNILYPVLIGSDSLCVVLKIVVVSNPNQLRFLQVSFLSSYSESTTNQNSIHREVNLVKLLLWLAIIFVTATK